MPNSGYVKKSQVRWLVTGLVLGLFLTMAVGLTVVRNQARDYATKQATIATLKVNDAKRASDAKIAEAKRKSDQKIIAATTYQTNYTTCGLRSLIDPQLKIQRQSLVRAKQSAADTSQSASVRARAQVAVTQYQNQVANSLKIRAIFGTVPPGLDCSTLPKRPPAL